MAVLPFAAHLLLFPLVPIRSQSRDNLIRFIEHAADKSINNSASNYACLRLGWLVTYGYTQKGGEQLRQERTNARNYYAVWTMQLMLLPRIPPIWDRFNFLLSMPNNRFQFACDPRTSWFYPSFSMVQQCVSKVRWLAAIRVEIIWITKIICNDKVKIVATIA